MEWKVLWCSACQEHWPVSEEEVDRGDVQAHSCPSCGTIGSQYQDLRPSKQEAAS